MRSEGGGFLERVLCTGQFGGDENGRGERNSRGGVAGEIQVEDAELQLLLTG